MCVCECVLRGSRVKVGFSSDLSSVAYVHTSPMDTRHNTAVTEQVALLDPASKVLRDAPFATSAAIPSYLSHDVESALKFVDSLSDIPQHLEPIIENLFHKLEESIEPPGKFSRAPSSTTKAVSEEPAAVCRPRRRRNAPCSRCGSTRY